MLELKRRELQLKLYGEEYNLLFPTNRMVTKYRKNFGGTEDPDAQEFAIYTLLEDCGLPRDVAEDMETEHLAQVINHLIPSGDAKK